MGSTLKDEITLIRPALTVEQKWKSFGYTPAVPQGVKESISKKIRHHCTCSSERLLSWLMTRIPIISWLPKYPIRSALLGDVIAGTTVAIMHIPQGMAYALLANLPPITGIYMAFFPVLIYVLLGTSRHVSMGTFAVACLMMGKVVNELSTDFREDINPLKDTNISNIETSDNDHETYSAQQVAAVLALMVGLWEILFGILQLGALLNVFLTEMLISGFTTGVAFHVLTSQVKYLFGIKVTAFNGPLKIIYTYMEIFQNILSANIPAMLISAICILLLVFNNEMKPKLKKYTNIPIPIELIVVVIGTLASYFGDLHELYNVRIVGDIPTGLPFPSLPPVSLMSNVAIDAFIISVIGYSSTFSMSKIFAMKNGYSVDATQELYAQGLSNVFGSFFSCGPMAASLSRSLIQEAVGGVTLLTPFISCCFILLILLFVGPVFETLPNCVLSSIIVVSLKGLLMQMKELNKLWSISKIDAIIWLSTFSISVIIDIDYGLMVGVAVSILVLLLKSQCLTTASLGQIPNTDVYLDVDVYPQALIIPGIRIFYFGGSLHFANVAYFREKLFSKTGLNTTTPADSFKEKSSMETVKIEGSNEMMANTKTTSHFETLSYTNEALGTELKDQNVSNHVNNKMTEPLTENRQKSNVFYINEEAKEEASTKDYQKSSSPNVIQKQDVKWLIVDMKSIMFIDSTGAKLLSQMCQELKNSGITLCIAAASDKVMDHLNRCGSVSAIGSNNFFHSIHDAVTIITAQNHRNKLNSSPLSLCTSGISFSHSTHL